MGSNKPKWGQNFLVDKNICHRIVELFDPKSEFGEIGPGHGALTDILRTKYESFTVFEIDPQLAAFQRTHEGAQVVEGDFLAWNYCLDGKPVQNYSLIGNLPYESGSLILKELAFHSGRIDHFLFMLQKEVVQRVCASHKTRDFSSFTVIMQSQFDLEALDIIPPESFSPPPKVTSQLVRGRKKSDRQNLSPAYLDFLHKAFSNKRKTFRNAMKAFYPLDKIDGVLEKFELSSMCRAEEIELNSWPLVFREFTGGC